MNDFINSRYDVRSDCWRKVEDEYFGNDQLEEPTLCRSTCTRCSLSKEMTPCCDVSPRGSPSCTLSELQDLVKSHRATNQINIRMCKENELDKALRKCLMEWREDKAKEIFGNSGLDGGSRIMMMSIMNHIVALNHILGSNLTVELLAHETQWGLSEDFGPDIIAFCEQHRPPPPTNSAPASGPFKVPTSNTPCSSQNITCGKCCQQRHSDNIGKSYIQGPSILYSIEGAKD